MSVSYVSGASAASTSLTMPSHQSGDLLLMMAFRDGSTTTPTVPSGWASFKTAGANSCSGVVAYKVASSSSETCGTWTNATGLTCQVYRGVTGLQATAGTSNTGSSNSITYPALTVDFTDSTSWVVRFAGHRTATNITTNTPTGYTARAGTAAECRGCDTNGGVSSSPGTATQSVNASSGWVSFSVEVVGKVGSKADTLTDDFSTGSYPDTNKWDKIESGVQMFLQSQKLQAYGMGAGAVTSKSLYDAAGSSVWAQYTDGAPLRNVSVVPIGLQDVYAGSLGAFWVITASGAYASDNLGDSSILCQHSAGTWYRIRESSGSLYYDTSSNGLSWTTQATRTGYGHFFKGACGILAGNLSCDELWTFTIDNVNITPAGSSFFAMF